LLKSPSSSSSSAIAQITYQNFINSIRAEETKKKYSHALDKYIEFLGLKKENSLINHDIYRLLLEEQDPRIIENKIINYIINLKNEGYSSATISLRLAGIMHFYTMNDIVLNKKKIGKYLGEHKKTIKDRAYTREEINKILDACGNLKYKIVVTMMASTGCRVGSITAIKFSDIRYFEKEKLHQIFFYINTKEEYFSFCSRECSKYILEYQEYRERKGETIKPESPLIRDDFTDDDILHIENPRPITDSTIKYYLQNILIKTGLRTPIKQEGRGQKRK
jgi:integrase